MEWPHQDQKRRATLKGRFLSLPTLVSFGLALAFLFFLVTRFDIDLSKTWESFNSSNHGLFILAFFIHYTTFVFRGARWSLLLKNAGTSAPGSEQQAPIGGEPVGPSTPLCAKLLLLGWFTNSVTWFRLGDAYRAYLYSGKTRSSFSHTMGTILAERVLDTLLVFILLVVSALFLVRGGVGTSWMFVALSALLLFILAVVLVLMGLFRWRLAKHLPRALEGAFRRFHQGTCGQLSSVAHGNHLGAFGMELGNHQAVLGSRRTGILLEHTPCNSGNLGSCHAHPGTHHSRRTGSCGRWHNRTVVVVRCSRYKDCSLLDNHLGPVH